MLIQPKVVANQPVLNRHFIVHCSADAFSLYFQTHVSLLLGLQFGLIEMVVNMHHFLVPKHVFQAPDLHVVLKRGYLPQSFFDDDLEQS